MTSTTRTLALALIAAMLPAFVAVPAVARPIPANLQKTPLAEAVDTGTKMEDFMVTLDGAVFTLRKNRKTGEVSRAGKGLQLFFKRVNGKWQEKVTGLAPGFNQGASRGTIADKSTESKLVMKINVGSDRWVKGDPAAEYTLDIQINGKEVTGTFEGTFQGQKVQGKVTGMVRTGGWVNCTEKDGAVLMEFDLGTRRSNWNNARWAVNDLITPLDLSGYDGIVLTVETDNPRADAFVDLGLMENDGSWYYVRDAAPLTQKKQTVAIDFDHLRHAEWVFNAAGTGPGGEGNFDENFHFDRSAAVRLAIGVVNAEGVGKVKFRVTEIALGKWKKQASGPVKVNVSGKTVSVNKTEKVPDGLFGFHTAGGSDDQCEGLRVGSLRPLRAQGGGGGFADGPNPKYDVFLRVSTNYDRRQQLPFPSWGGDWQQKCRSAGQSIGRAAKPHGTAAAVEWWNEPYLDLGRMLPGQIMRIADKDQDRSPGKPVFARGRKLESMVWTKVGDGKVEPRDPSRFTYWSGRQIGIFYNESYNLMAAEAKKIAPDVQLVGGFGFRWQEDDWASWNILYKPMIDECIRYLDGVCEHHYQGHTDGMAASYEVLMAYGVMKHNKRLPSYNTETNDLWDAPARGRAAAGHQFGGRFKARKRLVYNLRDILYCVKETPDKIVARAIHALWKGQGDNRVRIGDTIRGNKNRDGLTVKSARWTDEVTVDGKSMAAAEGKKLLVLDVEAVNRRGRGKRKFSPGVAVVKSDGETVQVKPRQSSVPDRVEKTADGRVVFELPAAVEKTGIVTYDPGRGWGKVVHVSGEFREADIAPHRKAGIDLGEYECLKFLYELRGQLVDASSSDENVWVVSSIDERTGALVAVVFNDDHEAREAAVTLAAPQGTQFAGLTVETLHHDDEGKISRLLKTGKPSSKESHEAKVTIAPASAVKMVLKLRGKAPEKPQLERTQIFCGAPKKGEDPILFDIKPGEKLNLPIDLPADASSAKRAWVRVVVENAASGEGSVTVGSKTLAIPASHTPCNAPYIRMIEIDPAALAGVKELTFHAADMKAGNGYRLGMGSIVIER
ncbi:MAG: hypothetical protein ACLFV7_13045 [Phycisphaerae bacterium]